MMAAEDFVWIKDVAIPCLTLGVGFLGARLSDWSRSRGDAQKREQDHETVQLSYDQAQMNTLTTRFQALMDGYERRINDLVKEVQELRQRLTDTEIQLRTAIDARNVAPRTPGST